MSTPAERQPIADTAPSAEHVTDYDRAHAATYLRLLDAVAANAPWAEIAQTVLEIDATKDPKRARVRYESHLARARWMADRGYRDLLRSSGS